MRRDIEILRTGAVVLAVTMGFAVTAWAGGVKIQNPVPYARNAEVRATVRAECQVGQKLASYLEQFGDDVELVTGAPGGSGRVLQVEITDVFAPGGGVFSGPKWMQVKGTLKQNGEVLGSFRAKRVSTGAFTGFSGTCGVLARCARSIAQDIAAWLGNPGKGSLLGNAR
jgi:hypothetical protein